MLFKSERSGDGSTLQLCGAWCIDNLPEMEATLAQLSADRQYSRLDLSGIQTLDLSGAWLLRNWLEKGGGRMEVVGPRPAHFAFLDELLEQKAGKAPVDDSQASLRDAVVWVGRGAVQQAKQTRDAVGFFGRITMTVLRSLRSAHNLRLPSIARHIYETGIQAIPIVSLIAFLISVIVAYLGAQQLRQFGAEIFTVDLVAISVLREMGVLLTSIIVAGRSGSAFAAEIGVMRLNDEIDALESMGVDFYEVLVAPRLIGLLIALPLLTIVADAMGLAGGAILSSLLLDISLSQFIPRVQDALAPTTFWAGLIKAPVFAMLIALVGTYRGMQVRDSSRELGRLTTVAVVQSIFLVIFADAVFAVVFVELDF
ncbi:MAG TPA: MlaE family lipid ABC transporter permease subunit [Steroidobacter sp.]|uniref:ABC transporter permease n=1 Tax=Steroidobacter sp. TaxID=1978227 RepID=UPI002ED876FB